MKLQFIESTKVTSCARILFGLLSIFIIARKFFPYGHEDRAIFCLFIVAALSAFCVTLGLQTRAACATLGCIFLGLFFGRDLNFLNMDLTQLRSVARNTQETTLYLIAVIMLLFSNIPCDEYYSVRNLYQRRKKIEFKKIPAVSLLRYQICAMYIWAGISKLNQPFLSGVVIEQIWIKFQVGSFGYYPHQLPSPLLAALGWSAAIFEMALGCSLLVPKLRKGALTSGVVFHIALCVLMRVWIFSCICIISYLFFLERPSTATENSSGSQS